jgi:elongation factor G
MGVNMADYLTKDIRNIAFLGHGAEGKTTLTEAILYAAGHIDRIGKVEDGSTVTDYDPEEHKRGISISASVAPVEWRGTKVNILDCPGYFDFVGEALGALRVVETACIVVNGVSGMSVGAEKAWKMAVDNNVARMFIVNQMDRDHADFKKVLDDLRERYGNSVVPLIIPIGYGPDFKGVVNILENVAFEGSGKNLKEVPVPESLNDIIAQYNEEITEAAAENDDELIEKYFDQGFLTPDEIAQGFLQGMAAGTIVPVVAVSATQGIGIESLMRVIKKYLNSPENSKAVGVNPKTDEPVERACSNDEPFSAFVFKTISDPFVGKLSLFKVKSGSITPQTALYTTLPRTSRKNPAVCLFYGAKGSSPPNCLTRAISVRCLNYPLQPPVIPYAMRPVLSATPLFRIPNPAFPRLYSPPSRAKKTRSLPALTA